MVFSSLAFLCVFLPVVLVAYWLIPHMATRNYLLILASLFFYAFGEPVYVVLMIFSTVFNYGFGRFIAGAKTHGKAKTGLVVSVVVNLAFLGVFKYAGMFVETADALFGLSWNIPIIALPIGISFYTFQAMSYVIDVYRGEVKATKSYARVLLYISFFPQLIAGPIIKYHDVEEQLSHRTLSVENIALGMRRFCVGLAKKVLIANTMAVVVDSIYAAPLSEINIAVAWIAALAYLMQIYFDFSGYSDMAIGLARMFGFHFKENFDYPYISSSIQEFWRRWHISLSTWFKEYLYIPLGGNRKGRARAGLNKIIVFFFCGLWHGASWTFVVWGLFHGFFLLLEEYLPIKRFPKPVGIIYSLLVVTVGFVLFRAESFEQGVFFISQMFTGFHFEFVCIQLAMQQLTPLFIATFLVAIIACTPIKRVISKKVESWAAARQSDDTQRTKAGSNSWHDAGFEGTYTVAANKATAVPRVELEGLTSQTTGSIISETEAEVTIKASKAKTVRIVIVCTYVLAFVLLFLALVSLSGGGYNPFIYFRF